MPKPRAQLSWVKDDSGEPIAYEFDHVVLNDLLDRRGMKRATLAERALTSRGYITDICKGQRAPGIELLHRIADAVDVPWRALICRVVVAQSDAPMRDEDAA